MFMVKLDHLRRRALTGAAIQTILFGLGLIIVRHGK